MGRAKKERESGDEDRKGRLRWKKGNLTRGGQFSQGEKSYISHFPINRNRTPFVNCLIGRKGTLVFKL